MDLRCAGLDELAECLFRQRRSPVLHGSAQPVLFPAKLGDVSQGVEVNAHVRHAAVGQDKASVPGAGLDAQLADARQVGAVRRQGFPIILNEDFGLIHRRVLAPDLPNLSTDGHRDSFRLDLPDEPSELDRLLEIQPLLLFDVGLAQVHEGRRVNIDVIETRLHRLPGEIPQVVELLVRILCELLGVELKVISLNEERPAAVFLDRSGQNRRRVFTRPLLGVTDFRTGDLEEKGPHISSLRRADNRPRGIKREASNVDGGNRESAHLSPAHRHIKIVNGGRPNSLGFGHAPDEPSAIVLHLGRGVMNRVVYQTVYSIRTETPFVLHPDAPVFPDFDYPPQGRVTFASIRPHHSSPSQWIQPGSSNP